MIEIININACTAAGQPDIKDEHFQALNAFINEHKYGVHTISILDAKEPQPAYRARVAEPRDVEELADSFMAFQSVHSASMFVVFWPQTEHLPRRDVPFNLHDPASLAKCRKGGFFFIIGDHTQRALKQLTRRFPKNPLFQTVTGQLLIVHRNTQTIRRLKSWGIIDNIKGQRRTALSFSAKIHSIHEDHEQLSLIGNSSPSDLRDALAEVKRQRCKDYQIPLGSFGQLWSIASRDGEIWKCISQMLRGDIQRKNFKAPRSASNFTSMGAIDDEDLLVLLRDVTEGNGNMKTFAKACQVYKARVRVQTEILNFLQLEDWEAAQDEFPKACSVDNVDVWADFIVNNKWKKKSPMPSNFFKTLSNKADLDRQIKEAKDASVQVSISLILMKSHLVVDRMLGSTCSRLRFVVQQFLCSTLMFL